MEENKRVEYPFDNPDCPEFDTCFELKIAMSQKEKDDQKGEITKDVIFQTAGGSPLGVYPTLDDIQKAYDTGEIDSTKGVYLSMDDGFWNYYDQKLNKWVKGKLYQETAVNPEDPTIVKINDAILTVGDNLNEHIGNATIKFGEIDTHQDLQDKRLDDHRDLIINIENELHETEVVEVKESFTGNKINVPTSASVEGRNFQTINNQLYKVSGIKGQTKKSKNLLVFPYATKSKTENGVTFKVNDDGTVLVNGTATANTFFPFCLAIGELKDVTISGCPSGGTSNSYLVQIYSTNGIYADYGKGKYLEYVNINDSITIKILKGYTCNNLLFKPQINKGSRLPYERYFKGMQDTTIKNISSIGTNRVDLTEINNNGNITQISEGEYRIPHSALDVEVGKTIFKNTNNYKGQVSISYDAKDLDSGSIDRMVVIVRCEYTDGTVEIIPGGSVAPRPNFTRIFGTTNSNKEVKAIYFSYLSTGTSVVKNIQVTLGNKDYGYIKPMTDTTIELKPNMLTLKGIGNIYDEAILTKTLDDMGEPTELFEVDVIKRTKTIDLATLKWNYTSSDGIYQTAINDKANGGENMITDNYEVDYTDLLKMEDNTIRGGETTKIIYVKSTESPTGNITYVLETPTRSKVKDNLPLGEVSVLGQWGGEFQINPIEPNIVEPKETSFNFDIRYWEQPTNKGGNL